jgi:hypothetical protein
LPACAHGSRGPASATQASGIGLDSTPAGAVPEGIVAVGEVEEHPMSRRFVGVVLVLAVVFGAGRAAGEDKKGQTTTGTIKKVDASAGTFTVTVKGKAEAANKDFNVSDATKVVVYDAKGGKKEATGKEGLKNAMVKEGVNVAVHSDADGKVTEVQIGNVPTGTTTTGMLKKVDAESGTLTLTIGTAKGPMDKDFTVTDSTKVFTPETRDKKEQMGKAALKSEHVKAGIQVSVKTDADGKVTEVHIGPPVRAVKE